MPGPKKTRILVADDEPAIRELMNTVLSLWGFEVTLSPEGRDAFAQASEGDYALLLIDNQMPLLTGVEVLQNLRSAKRTLPAILMSGHISPQVLQVCDQLGGIQILPKPFSLDELRDSLTRLIGPAMPK